MKLLLGICLISIQTFGQELKLKSVFSKRALEKTLYSEENPHLLRDRDRKNILHHAASKDNEGNIITFLIETYPELLESRDFDGYTPLHFAAFHGNYRAVDLLLTAGAQPNSVNKVGKTPAHKVVQLMVEHKKKECVVLIAHILNLLFTHNGNLNQQDRYGNTLLHDAALTGNQELFDHLQNLPGIIVGIKNRGKYTPAQLLQIAKSAILAERHTKNNAKPFTATSV